MELTMSMFATPADYWKARAELAEKTVTETAAALGCKPDNEAMLTEAGRLKDALFVLGMVDKNNRIDAGEKGKAWSGRFVADEVQRVLAGRPNDEAKRTATARTEG